MSSKAKDQTHQTAPPPPQPRPQQISCQNMHVHSGKYGTSGSAILERGNVVQGNVTTQQLFQSLT